MAWLGLITWITLYGCFFMAAYTGRFSWLLLCVWWVPVLGMCLNYRQGMNINGLMVIICIGMFLISRKSLTDVKMWNLKMRKRKSILFGIGYLFCLLFLYYCFWQVQKEGYLLDIQGASLEVTSPLRIFLGSLPMIALAFPLTEMVYNSLDRIWCKKREVVLLACKFFTSGANGEERGLWQGYYLDAIHNGASYHFKMTKRNYHMLKKEKNLRLQVKVGLLGGWYVTENPCPDHVKKVRKSDRRAAIIGVSLLLLVSVTGVWYFWFLV
jgi:hypothetical protein